MQRNAATSSFVTARFIILAALTVILVGCGDPGYDKPRFERMQQVIGASTNKLLGLSLVDACKQLSLDHVLWDPGYTSEPLGHSRIYHFRGFYLELNLHLLPRGVTPDSQKSYQITDTELRSYGVWWVANFDPFLQIDKLTDPKQRMSNYWQAVNESFKRRTAQMNASKPSTNK